MFSAHFRKGSTAQGSSDSPSETDSQQATSLLEVSHKSGGGSGGGGAGAGMMAAAGALSRKRSGSRASLGSRAKSLRLTEEQKCGIASR